MRVLCSHAFPSNPSNLFPYFCIPNCCLSTPPGVSRAAALRIIVIEGLFKPSDFLDPTFSDELESDIASECEKCGAIEKLTFFSSNPRGIAVVKFGTSYAAQECIRLMNGRFFAGLFCVSL